MRSRAARWILASAALGTLAVAPSAPAATPALPIVPGPLAAVPGVLAYSVWDADAGGYRLVAQTGDGGIVLPHVRKSGPFDVSAGTSPTGRPHLAWSDCTKATDCHVHLTDARTGRDRVLTELDAPGTTATTPALDGRRIAWVRRAPGRHARPTVMVATLGAPDSAHAVSAVPVHSCAVIGESRPGRRCPRLEDVEVRSLALSGRHVGLVATTSTCECQGYASMLILADVGRPGPRVVDTTRTGGFTAIDLVGPAFDGDSLYAAESCTAGDGNGCRRHRIVVRAPLDGGRPQAVPAKPLFGYARSNGFSFGIPQAHCYDPHEAELDPGTPPPACRVVALA